MRTLLLCGMAFLLGACGRSDDDAPADAEPPVIHTGEVCKVDGDCKMDPGRAFCRDNTAVRYEIPTCGSDQRCAWSKLENRCDLRCEDGYCITAVR